jgi:hypothetical protein
MDLDELKELVMREDFDPSHLPCHLLAVYWYVWLAMRKYHA